MRKTEIYCSTYCNKGHRLSDGRPVRHECHILPPAALAAEIAGDIPGAIAILCAAQPLPIMRRGVRA
jgi:hypothetical protein